MHKKPSFAPQHDEFNDFEDFDDELNEDFDDELTEESYTSDVEDDNPCARVCDLPEDVTHDKS